MARNIGPPRDEQWNMVLEGISEGLTIKLALARAKISQTQFYYRCTNDEEFKENVDAQAADCALKLIRMASKGEKGGANMLNLLFRRFYQDFPNASKITGSVEVSHDIKRQEQIASEVRSLPGEVRKSLRIVSETKKLPKPRSSDTP